MTPAEILARGFHDQHELLYRPPALYRGWENMPADYRHRLATVFDHMIRTGQVSPGPQIPQPSLIGA